MKQRFPPVVVVKPTEVSLNEFLVRTEEEKKLFCRLDNKHLAFLLSNEFHKRFSLRINRHFH